MILRILTALIPLLLAAASSPAVDLIDLSKPESAAVDYRTGDIFVSNVNGGLLDKDSNGYISKLSADGVVIVLKFLESKEGFPLHAPKGIEIIGKILYAVDVDAVMAFDLDGIEKPARIDLSSYEPKFLNDIAADPKGNLYVSDMQGNKILKIDTKNANQVSVFKDSASLGQPNGLLFNTKTNALMVATWEAGELLEVDKNGRIRILRRELGGGWDGLTADSKGTIYLSNFTKGEIYQVGKWGRGPLSLFKSALQSPADISFDPFSAEILVPMMDSNSLTSFKVPNLKQQALPRKPVR